MFGSVRYRLNHAINIFLLFKKTESLSEKEDSDRVECVPSFQVQLRPILETVY